jgi:DNA-binding response OmpR family regulator
LIPFPAWEGGMKTIALQSQSKKRILYIEDHKDSREMLAVMLRCDVYEVATATSAADGLSIARLEQFDLYILDSRFTDGTGLDLCRQIRAYDPGTPIIFYSSLAFASDIQAGLAAGAQHYLIKPDGIYSIEQSIAELLASATQARAYTQRRRNNYNEWFL